MVEGICRGEGRGEMVCRRSREKEEEEGIHRRRREKEEEEGRRG